MSPKFKSKQPRKQRKRIYTAHNFLKHKLMSARLSKDLQEKYSVKRMPVRVGDVVLVTTGEFYGTEGKVLAVDYKKSRVEIEGIAKEKADKSKIMYPVHTSKIVIRRFGKMDQKRKDILQRRAKKEVAISEEDIIASGSLASEAIEEE